MISEGKESIDFFHEILKDKRNFFEKLQKTFGNQPVTNPQFFVEGFAIMLAMIFVKNNIPEKTSMLTVSELFLVAYEGLMAAEVAEKNGETVH